MNNKTKYGEDILICPRCKIEMEKIKKNDIIIDVCRKCKGMWLDDGEIEKLANYAKNINNKK